MAIAYSQIHLYFVFAPRFRAALIHSSWEEERYQYISGVVQNHGQKMLAINGMPDHLHFLAGIHPTQSASALMKTVKYASTRWANDRHFCPGRFEWQDGFGVFSYAKSQIPDV